MSCHYCYQQPCICTPIEPTPMAFLKLIQENEIQGIRYLLKNLSNPPSNLNSAEIYKKEFINEEKRADCGSLRGASLTRGKEPDSGDND